MDDIFSNKEKFIKLILMIIIFMMFVTGTTYAFLSLSDDNASASGTIASASIDIKSTEIIPRENGTGKYMVPIASYFSGQDNISSAMSQGSPCLDSFGNILCKIYEIELHNTSTANIAIRGTLNLEGEDDEANFENLKWYKFYEGTSKSGISYSNPVSVSNTYGNLMDGNLTTSSYTSSNISTLSINAGGKYYYYIVVWIEDVGSLQNDYGTFIGNLEFYNVNVETGERIGGITSTVLGQN